MKYYWEVPEGRDFNLKEEMAIVVISIILFVALYFAALTFFTSQ